MEFKKQIEEEIKKRKEIYKSSPSDMISAYNREIETEKEYNGRQLLELLQNADDEKSDEVEIRLDTQSHTLTISNRGDNCTPFSYKGIRALMISNLSPKTNQKFIGNKGLGFRSIINWSDRIIINSNGLDIVFSREIVDNIFDELFNTEEKEKIKNESKHKDTKSIPFLSIPTIIEKTDSEWTTSIIIKYKNDYLEDIKKQINELKDEILLFLNHIKKLVIIVDNEVQLNIEKETLSKKWTIFEKREKLPNDLWDNKNEAEYFDLKIALQDNLENDIKELFAYFPTKIDIDFPFIIHGTFELNSSRNEINDSPKNRYILKQLVELIIATAKEISQKEISYKALEMLSYKNKHKILEELGFYSAIDNAIESLEVFPCLDGKYRKMCEVVYSNELSIFVKSTSNEDLFNNLLIEKEGFISLDSYHLETSIETEKLNQLSNDINSMEDRVELIHLFYINFTHKHKLIFLIDEENELVNLDDEVYTPSRYNFSIPNFINIKFIHQGLFDKLILKFKIVSTDKARELQRKLKDITNIQSYEPAQVLQKIISSTNNELKKEDSNKSEIIKEMVKSLYKNYILLDKTKIPSDTKIQLLNKENKLYDAKNLFLSKTYPSGVLTEELFENIIPMKAFLSDGSEYNFKTEELEEIEAFFIWLGVNKHTKFKSKAGDSEYERFVFSKIQKPINYRDSSLELKGITPFEEIIEKLSLEKIILWFILDEKIKVQLNDTTNTDLFKYSKSGDYRGYHYHSIHEKPSYILYQIIKSEIFKDYLITTDKLSNLVNQTTIDFNSKLFKEYDIGEHTIKALLLKVGAVEKFEDLSIERVREILRDLANTSPDGKQTATIYKAVRNHKKILNDSSIQLCAIKNREPKYYYQDEIYYVNTTKLPRKILENIPILNLPPRIGNVTKFFGIKDIKEIEINIESYDRNTAISDKFKIFLEKIKVFILVNRFEDLKDEKTKKDNLKWLKDSEIILCDNVTYTLEGKNYELDNNDYIEKDKKYYIKIENNSIEKIRKTLDFREAFTDIMGLIFKIKDIEKFERIVSDDISETEEIIKRKFRHGEIEEVREYLGIADEFSSFWRNIYDLKDKEYQEKIREEDIKVDLNLSFDIFEINYMDINCDKNYKGILKLFIELNISIKEFNDENPYYKIDFREYHTKNLKNTFNDNLFKFKQLLYKKCKETSIQKEFLNRIGEYENYSQELENRLDINYQEIVEKFLKETFGIDLEEEVTSIELESIYDTNKKKIDFEQIEALNEYRSLLYFDDKIDAINHYMESIKPNSTVEQISTIQKSIELKNIVDTTLSTPNTQSTSSHKSTKPYKVSSSQNQRKKEIGDTAEQEVYQSLVKDVGIKNVEWVSKNDDTSGYDIKYKNHDNLWKYVEVKKYSNEFFYFSKSEKEFAEKNKDDYEIFLVGDYIYKIQGIDFEDEIKFRLEPDTYKVYYKL